MFQAWALHQSKLFDIVDAKFKAFSFSIQFPLFAFARLKMWQYTAKSWEMDSIVHLFPVFL